LTQNLKILSVDFSISTILYRTWFFRSLSIHETKSVYYFDGTSWLHYTYIFRINQILLDISVSKTQ